MPSDVVSASGEGDVRAELKPDAGWFAERRAGFAAAVAARSRQLARGGNLYQVLKSASMVLGIRIAGAGLAYASMVALARWLGAFEFGIYAFVSVLVTLLALALSIGFNSSALRFIPAYLAGRRRLRRLNGFLTQSYLVIVGISVLGAVAGATVLNIWPAIVDPHYQRPLLVGLACVPIWALLNQGEVTARGFGWVNLAYSPSYVIRPLLMILFVGAAYAFDLSGDAMTGLAILTGVCALTALGQSAILRWRIRPLLSNHRSQRHSGYWARISLGFLMIDGFRMLLDNTDVMLIGKLLDPQSVAVYFAVIRTAGLVGFVSFSIVALAVPKFSELHATKSRDELQRFVSSVIQMTFWPTLICALGLAAIGPFVLRLFGPGFESGYPTMLVVLVGLVLRAATLPVESLLNVSGHHRDTVRVYAAAGLGNVLLSLVLIPAFGIIGAAISTYAAILSGNALLYLLVRKRLGVRAFVFPIGGRSVAPVSRV